MFDTVAIAGMGLIGGSLGMALRRRGLAKRVVGIVRREATIDEALLMGAVDAATLDTAEGVAGADLVVLAAPVLAFERMTQEMAPHLKPGALVTDVGSTKAELTNLVSSLLPDHADFIGGHPMAGSEKGGVLAAREYLFEGAVWVLTRAERSRPENIARLAALARALGSTPVEMEPSLHDDAVARISHLPHVVAAALAEAADQGAVPSEVLRMLVAGGFKSTTRIASSPPEMWRDICLTNRQAVLASLSDFEAALARFRAALEQENAAEVLDAFARGKEARDLLAPPEAA